MNRVFNRYAIVCLAALVLSGCASFTPEKMYDGEIKSKKDVATILGQKYRKAWNYHVHIFVSKVDGKETFNEITAITLPNVIHVDPGTRELEIYAAYGNAASHLEHSKRPTMRVNVEAGQVYQIDSQLLRAHNYDTAAEYALRHIGDFKEYEDYLSKHPEYEPGSLLPKLN